MLTKSGYKAGVRCPKELWLLIHQPELKSPLSASIRARLEAGAELGRLARQLFSGGVEAPYVGLTNEEAAVATAELLAQTPLAIFEGTFVAGEMMARVDILVRMEGGWRLIEVKSSKEYRKPNHLPDIAYQAAVLEAAGIPIVRYEVMHLDGDFRRVGNLVDPVFLFRATDVTNDVRAELAKTRAAAESLLTLWGATEYPKLGDPPPHFDPGLRAACRECDFFKHCESLAPPDHLLHLGLSQTTAKKLRASGITNGGAIPDGMELSPLERLNLAAHRTGVGQAAPNLAEMLGVLRYPAHLIDFETAAEAVPFLPGTQPYEPIPFQWSSHTVSSPSAAWVGEDRTTGHFEFLYTDQGDPRPAFVASLIEALQGEVSVVHYSAYERTTIRQLVESGIPRAEELQELVSGRLVDLREILKAGYADARFKGLTSIKVVLPVVAPDVSYGELAIGEGDQAQKQYVRAFIHAAGPEEREQIFRDLRAYCQLDTWAMVLVLRHLLRAAKEPEGLRD